MTLWAICERKCVPVGEGVGEHEAEKEESMGGRGEEIEKGKSDDTTES